MKPLPYLLYPPKVEAQAPFPLIVFLHGIGERGDNLELVKKWGLPRYTETGEVELPAYIAVPQCPADSSWMEDEVLAALNHLLDHLLATQPIDPDRVCLTGFSMGGFGTWGWANVNPERFAALMPVGGSGYLDLEDLIRLKNKPIWIVHGALDKSVGVVTVDRVAWELSLRGSTFGYTRYPDADHGQTSDRAFADMALYRWMLAQKRETKA